MNRTEDDPKMDQINDEAAGFETNDPLNPQPEQTLARQGVTTLEPKRPIIPDRESWSYAGTDSTAVNDITILEVEDGDEDDGDGEDSGIATWTEYCQEPDVSIDDKIRSGIDLVKNLAGDYNLLINRTQKKLADRAILLGKFFLALKDLVLQKGEQWIP